MKYLLDTDICIYLIKQKPAEVLEKFRGIPLGEIGISSITVAELEYGVEKSRYPDKNRTALELFLAPLEIALFDRAAARETGVIRAAFERSGTPIGAYDLQIAGQARARDVVLVTNNTKEFDRVDGLEVENWVDSPQ